MTPIHVLLADDHPVVRSGIRSLLAGDSEIQMVGEASTGNEAISLTAELAPDVVILDMELPDLEGSQVAMAIHRDFPQVKILALSAHDDDFYIKGVMASGASGYLMKEEAPEKILEAIHGIARGDEGWISRRVSAKMATWMKGGSENGGNLSDREMNVLHLVVQGDTNQAIAIKLQISEKTVEKYLAAIFAKLKVNSRVEAAVYAVRARWFEEK